jgi:hypothetical protein
MKQMTARGGISMSGDTADQAALRQSLMTNLKSESAQKIDFWCNGIHVDAGGFNLVYGGLITRLANVAIDPTLPPDLLMYGDTSNTFYFPRADFGNPRSSTVAERALTIHESVHAMVDLSFQSAVDWGRDSSPKADRYRPALQKLQEEAVGYVAQALFYVNELGIQDSVSDNLEFAMAIRVANRIAGNDGAHVTGDEVKNLQDAIAADPHYQEELKRSYWSEANG